MLTDEVVKAIEDNGALTIKQILDLCPSVVAAQQLVELVNNGTLVHTFSLAEGCDHGQLYANLTVTFSVSVEHNSAREMEKAYHLIDQICNWSVQLTKCYDRPEVKYNIQKKVEIKE